MDTLTKGEELLSFFDAAYQKMEVEKEGVKENPETTGDGHEEKADEEATPPTDEADTTQEPQETAEQQTLTDFTDALMTGVQQAQEPKTKKTRILQDFGEKIGGARKDAYNTYKALLFRAMESETKSRSLKELWPLPKYNSLLKAGMEPWRVAAIRALRDAAPIKATYTHERDKMLLLRSIAAAVLKGEYEDESAFKIYMHEHSFGVTIDGITGYSDISEGSFTDKQFYSHAYHLYQLYSALGTEKSLKKYYIIDNASTNLIELYIKDNSLQWWNADFGGDHNSICFRRCGSFEDFSGVISKVKEMTFTNSEAKESESEPASKNTDGYELIPGLTSDYVIKRERSGSIFVAGDGLNIDEKEQWRTKNYLYTISRKISSDLNVKVACVDCKDLHQEFFGDKPALTSNSKGVGAYDHSAWEYLRAHRDEFDRKFSEIVQSEKRMNRMKHYQIASVYDSKNRKRNWVIQRKINKHRAVTIMDVPLTIVSSRDEKLAAQQYFLQHFEEVEEKYKQLCAPLQERNEKNEPRIGRRHLEEDVTPELYQETFGFHGVEFGNWEEGKTRQENLNASYEALLDLADALGVEPKALSLGGTLGLRFGSNGRGGRNPAAAHYEPDFHAINLTKMNGAGCLAHEWFHALDDYLGHKSNLHALLSRQSSLIDATRIVREINHLKKYRGYSDDNSAIKYYEQSYSEDIKAFQQDSATAGYDELCTETAHGFGDAFTAIVHDTELVARSGILDATKKERYWGTTAEMFARSFEAYVKSQLDKKGVRNDFLVNFRTEEEWKKATSLYSKWYPYPTNDEMETINKGFQSLFDSIKTKTNEAGKVEFFSCSRMDCLGSLVEQSTILPASALSEEQNGLAAFSLEQLGLPVRYFDGPEALHGRYDAEEDILYLNRKGESDIGWTFYHEAFHALKKNDPKLYDDLLAFTEQSEMFTPAQMDAYRQEIHGKNLTDTQVKEEMLADAFADIKTRERSLATIVTKEPNLGVRLTSYFRRVADKAVSFFHRRKKQHPKAELTEKQFSAFRDHLQTVTQNFRVDGRYVLSDRHNILGCDGYPVTPQDMPETMIHFANPFPGDYKKQMAFDINSSMEMLKKYTPEIVLETLTKNSPLREEPGYVKTVVREANRRYREAFRASSGR